MKLVITLMSFLLFTISNSEFKKYNSGVLPYTISAEGELLILLGKGKNGYWIDFIGKQEKWDGGELAETATREFFQETNCIFNQTDIKAKILKSSPIKLNNSTYRYIIEIPYIEVGKIKSNTARCTHVEKISYCWIGAIELLKAVDRAKNNKNVFIPSKCDSKDRKLDKKMRKNLLKGTQSRKVIESLINNVKSK